MKKGNIKKHHSASLRSLHLWIQSMCSCIFHFVPKIVIQNVNELHPYFRADICRSFQDTYDIFGQVRNFCVCQRAIFSLDTHRLIKITILHWTKALLLSRRFQVKYRQRFPDCYRVKGIAYGQYWPRCWAVILTDSSLIVCGASKAKRPLQESAGVLFLFSRDARLLAAEIYTECEKTSLLRTERPSETFSAQLHSSQSLKAGSHFISCYQLWKSTVVFAITGCRYYTGWL